ncbi:hypothetical protein SUGI_0202970 [Cryptomeria japonica]|uniref:transcription factor IBH1 n=1 Tax=Cryptomeria japonica TaxID=3369 RepID=UPI002408E13E|nr:transcription factor IBH1 [Cryptomeria japonica]GLJ13000.1 hypothetical protein SUGI_0202970 [Cryptomeria japonica]
MNSRGVDSSSFRELYLRRFLWALKSIRRPTGSSQGDGDEVAEVLRSSRNVKLAADVSLALTANRAAWSRALLNRISSDEINRPALRKILEPSKFQAIIAQRARQQSRLIYQSRLKHAHMQQHNFHGLRGSKQSSLSLYRIFFSKRMKPSFSSHARMFNRRTRQLQMLVPGGESMEESCLLRETADYIRSLTIQVEVLQSLVNSVNGNQHPP